MSETIQPVLVTTEYRGVFFGYVAASAALDVTTIRIERARMCIYWSADVGGVLGLAAHGPTNGCRIGPAVPAITLHRVTSVTEVSPKAAEVWEATKWLK